MSEINKNETKGEQPRKAGPGEGIRSMKATWAFRALNFELYAKPSESKNDFYLFSLIIILTFRYCHYDHRNYINNKCVWLHRIYESHL